MDNYSSDYQLNYQKIQGDFNPYTAILRHPSQEFVFLPNAEPLQEDPKQYHSTKLIHNKNNSSSAVGSCESFVVPEVVQPSYARQSRSDEDTRSAGNPYEHHPNFANPIQYFSNLVKSQLEQELDDHNHQQGVHSNEEEQLLTIAEIENLADPFSSQWISNAYPVAVNPPNDVTLNKHLYSTVSSEDITRLKVDFPLKGYPYFLVDDREQDVTTQTLNKKMFSSESMNDLRNIDVLFEEKDDVMPESNLMKMRDFSLDSLAELRDLRNFSAYSGFHEFEDQPNTDDILEFQYTENVQYGGI